MSHSEATTAVLTANEPPNGTVLIVKEGEEYKVIVRDDKAAADAGYEDHWFEASGMDAEPDALHQFVKYADAVYALGDRLAEFR